ncbi:hypothetical protein HMI55_003907, partial [Coelomomyces lativittatus]
MVNMEEALFDTSELRQVVLLGDGHTLDATKIRKLQVVGKNKNVFFIENVLFVPGLSHSLLSYWQLLQGGFKPELTTNKVILLKENKVMLE